MSIDYTLRKATSFTPYEIFTNTYNGRRILPAAVSRISSVTWQPNKREMARNLCYLFAPFQRKGWDMKSCYVSLRKNPAGSPENKKKVTREKARASVNICLLRISKSNIHCALKTVRVVDYTNSIPYNAKSCLK